MNANLCARRWSLKAACAAVRTAVRSPLPFRHTGICLEECERRVLLASPLSSIPKLHSLPSATAKLFIDFDGNPVIPDWGGIPVTATPAYDRDNDPTTFSATELKNIQEIWARVAEKYSPFKIDVTTEDPGNRDNNKTSQIVVGGSYNDWLFSPAGGVAFLDAFSNDSVNTGFVFSEDGVDSNKSVAEAVTHEAGHTFGLQHHSLWKSDTTLEEEYDPGNTQWAPIMGVAYYSSRGLWEVGPTPLSAVIYQDDLEVLTNDLNGFGYRTDDYGNTQFSATALTGSSGTIGASGVITQSTDVDVFSFTTPAGNVSFNLDVARYGPMLNASLELRDAFGTVIASSKTVNWSESLTATVDAGTYYVYVSSNGSYGDLGQYGLTGQLPQGVIDNNAQTLLVSGTDAADVISITFEDGNYVLDVNGDTQTLDPSSIAQFNILAGAGDDQVTIGAGVAKCYILGGDGNDTLRGGENKDTISGSAGNDLILGGDGDDRLDGGNGRDIVDGGNGADRIYGSAGNDVMTGGAGVDRLYGGDDNDVLNGQSSADKLYGEYGNDTLYGGNGNDLLNGGVGIDVYYGQDGDDNLYSRNGTPSLVNGGAGTDHAQVDDDDIKQSLEDLLA